MSKNYKDTALAAVVASLLTLGGFTYSPVLAADTAAGAGNGVAIGTGSNAPKAENVAIGKGAGISYSNGASNATGDIVVGNGANINNYASQGGSIAIGKNAKVENMAGGGEASFAFGQTTYSGSWLSSARIPADPTKVVGSIAIGDNTFARTGSTMIGSHNYKGDLGDTTVDSASTRTDALNVYATTIGANSFSNGAFTTSTGVYNIISSEYNGGRFANPVKNLGATINGALNSIESKTGGYYSGIANTVSGIANRTFNANGSLIYGAGNEITNSITSLAAVPTDSGASAKEFAEKLRTTIRESESGGSTLAIGGGNKADYTQASQLIGVNNTLTGKSGAVSQYNMVNGYKNTATDVKHVSLVGSENTVENTDTALLLGDKRKLSEADGSIVLGSADDTMITDKKNVVVLGHNANATVEGGVALGNNSLASTDSGVAGYDPATKAASADGTSVWKATAAAVSVGNGTGDAMTRQITNVAAGAADTDAVNVAQLKMLQTTLNGDIATAKTEVKAGTNIASVDGQANPTDGHMIYTVNANGTTVSTTGTNLQVTPGTADSNHVTDYQITLSPALDLTSDGSLKIGNAVLDNEGLVIKHQDTNGEQNDVIFTGDNISAGGNGIHNVADGSQDNDAATVGQIKKAISDSAYTEGDGISIEDHRISVKTGKNLTVDGNGVDLNEVITVGTTKAVTIDGTKGEVSGLSNKEWTDDHDYTDSSKAATESQVYQAMKKAQETAESHDTDTHIQKGAYAVDEDHQVSMDIVDKSGKKTDDKVIITDIAKASEVGDVSQIDTDLKNKDGSPTTAIDAINHVNTKIGDQQYVTDGTANVVTNGDSVTRAIGALDKAIGEAATEAGKHSTVSAGSNIVVTPTTTAGKTDYQVGLAQDITVNSITADTVTASSKIQTQDLEAAGSATVGNVTINKDGKGTIGGLTNTTWDVGDITSGQAATEDQLKAATWNAVNYDGDDSKVITLREDTTIKNVADTTIEEGSKNAVNAGTVYKATKNAVNYDGDDSKTITLREDTTINNVADTTIEQGSKNAVNAGTVYSETRVEKDGAFVKQANTAGENLAALDSQLTTNTESIYRINNRVSNLDNRVNKVGAGAAALAALHPLDFDPDDKWDFAVGYGNYRNANSVAFGAFYRPNEDTMFSLGTNFGNGENMFNAGLSFKIGQGSGVTTSRTAMAKKIEGLEDTVDKQDKKIAELEALVKEQSELIKQYVGQN
ncbi:beta strand repeat-containing protein [Megasphaera sp.]|uniref:beta strand repeat-containing protein n=1 Tax=Megasphaera sp. TaxID=2023260 RepID=UPI00352127CD